MNNPMLPSMPPWGEDGTQLPRWAYSGRVEELVRRHGNDPRCIDGVPPLTCTSGPGVKLGFCALANLWAFFCVAPWIAYLRSSCPEDDGFAQCDDLVLYVLFFIVVLVGAWLQNRVMGYVVASQLAVTKSFNFLFISFNKLPYLVFITIMTGVMVTGYLDIMTNAETLGKTLATAHCDSYEKISSKWDTTMKESIFSFIPGFQGADFVHICFVAYLFMLAQPIFALLYSVPTESGVDYQAAFGEKKCGSEYKFEYKTLYEYEDSKTNHGAVLQVLAEATHMEAVNFQDLKYAEGRMETWKRQRLADWEVRFLHLAEVVLDRGVARFFLVGLFQNAIQTNLQISLMALTKEATGQQDSQLLFSATISMLSSLGDFPDAFEMFQLAWSARGFLLDADESYSAEVHMRIRNVQWKLVRFIGYMLLYAGMLGYAWVKLWGFFYCEHHLINVTGCVA